MLKWLIRRRVAAFERDFGYDATYMRQILDRDLGAFLRFACAQGISTYAPLELYYAAKITSAIAADCGPCAQLVVTMALREGLPGATIVALLDGDDTALTEPARIGRAFARAVLARDPGADELRDTIERRWGTRAVIALGYALVASQMFPTLKYALGFGAHCGHIVLDGRRIAPKRAA